ncbi:MAG: hypothetical protein L3J66_07120 [Bacteroidales bacterium]|nr:hypothetical protein [Bacteroidales bacterium]
MKKTTFCFIALSVIFVFVVKRGAAQTEFSKVYYQEFQSLHVNSVATAFNGSYVIAGEETTSTFCPRLI